MNKIYKCLSKFGVGGGQNEGKKIIDFFHVSDHLEQFGGLLFLLFFCRKINYLDGWGVPPSPVRGKFHLDN